MAALVTTIATAMTDITPYVLSTAGALAGVLVVIFGVRKLLSFVRRG